MQHKNKESKKSQISIEYMLTFGILLVILLITANVSLKNSRDYARIQQAQMALDKIAGTAAAINEMNIGSYKIIKVRFPQGSNLVNESKSFKLNYNIFGSQKSIGRIIDFTIANNLGALGNYETLKAEKSIPDKVTITRVQ